ncbi:MAG: hypothetical protein MUC95_06975 [Spirochaetes bacterium]|nr:hypothetical protein [Spirochaetota bacterium]
MERQDLKNRFIRIIAAIPVILILSSISYSIDKKQALEEYLFQKGMCSYGKAIDVLEDWTAGSSDPAEIETNIFRIGEIIKYPELIGRGIDVLNGIREKNQTVMPNSFLKARIDFLLIELYMRLGKTGEAERIRNSLGFIKCFNVAGPFRSGSPGDFENYNPPEEGYRSGAVYTGKIYNVSWFKASCGLSGMIDLSDLFKDIDGSSFYLHCELPAPEDGEYILSLGKTGFADIILDGRRIFSSRSRHSFCFDQYRIRMKLSKGIHTALIKLDDSRAGGLKAALRLTDVNGKPVEAGAALPGSGTAAEFLSSGYFPALDIIINAPSGTPDSFTAGYLLYISGLDSEEERQASFFFGEAKKNGALASYAGYYSGLLEEDDEKRDNHFYESIKANPKNIESITETAMIKIKIILYTRRLLLRNP